MTTETGAHGHGQGLPLGPGEHAHPQARQYLVIAAILTIITVVEVAIFYIEVIRTSPMFAPVLLVLSAVKFAIVVGFYMHLRFDNRLFTALFVWPLLIAVGVIVALLFLFGHFVLG
jgi:cytochrome c oxidase subunit 4